MTDDNDRQTYVDADGEIQIVPEDREIYAQNKRVRALVASLFRDARQRRERW